MIIIDFGNSGRHPGGDSSFVFLMSRIHGARFRDVRFRDVRFRDVRFRDVRFRDVRFRGTQDEDALG